MVAVLLIRKIVQLFLIMFFGCLIVKLGIAKSEDSKLLSKMAIYLLMPCVALTSFQVDFTAEVRDGLIFGAVIAIVLFVVYIPLAKLLEKVFHIDVVEKASIIYSNSVNLSIPIVSYVLGPEWVIYTSSFYTVQMVLMWSHGLSLFVGKGQVNVKKIVTNQNMIAIGVGIILLLTGLRFPTVVNETLTSVGDMVGPICMLNIGMIIGSADIKALLKNKRLYLISALRLIFYPIIALVLIKLSHGEMLIANGHKILLITFIAAMAPSASTMAQFAQLYNKDEAYASAINIMTTLLCIFTMPVFVFLYEMM